MEGHAGFHGCFTREDGGVMSPSFDLIRGCRTSRLRGQQVAGHLRKQTPAVADPSLEGTSAADFICPCRVCPACGHIKDDIEYEHPEDGLASCHSGNHGPGIFAGPEWWSHCGPYMDGRHLRSDVEREEWRAHDDLVWHGVRSGRGLEVARG